MPVRPPAEPLAVGTLLQRALDLFGRHAAVLLWCVVIVVTPLIVVAGAAAVAFGRGGARTYDLGVLLMAVVGALGGLVGVAACIRVAMRDRAGELVSVRDALAFGLRSYPALLGLSLAVAAVVFVGFVACVLPGIYLLVRWSMAVPALLVEGGDLRTSLNRGWALVEGRWWTTFGLLLAGYLVPAIVAAVVQQVVTAVFGIGLESRSPDGLLGLGVAQILGSCISMPFTALYLALLFGDLAATQPAAAEPRPDWPPPVAPAGPYGQPPVGPAAGQRPAPPRSRPAAIAPPPPAETRDGTPIAGGFLPPEPADPPASGDLAPPPERPPGAGD